MGPAVSAIFQEGLRRLGAAEEKCLPAVFCAASAFTLGVLVPMTVMEDRQQSSFGDEFMEDYRAQQTKRGNILYSAIKRNSK